MTPCVWVQGARQPSKRQEAVAARRMLHRSARLLLYTLALEALGLGVWAAGSAAELLGAVPEEMLDEETSQGTLKALGIAGNADAIRRELGSTLAALFLEPMEAVRRGESVAVAAQMAAGAVPGALRRPVGAAATAVHRTCLDMQRALSSTLPRQ
jgi:hypothetical protein